MTVAVEIPPHNLDAEESVIGCALLNPDQVMPKLLETLPHGTMFYRDAFGAIWDVMVELYRQGVALDTVTVGTELFKRGLLDAVGGKEALIGIMESTPTSAGAANWAAAVQATYLQRQMQGLARKLTAWSREPKFDLAEVAARVREGLAALEGDRGDLIPSPKAIASEVHDMATAALERRQLPGWSTGHDRIDANTLGYLPGSVQLLCAESGMGKTNLCWSLCRAFQRANEGLSAGIISLEMGAAELVDRQTIGDAFYGMLAAGKPSRADEEMIANAYHAGMARLREYSERPIRVVSPRNSVGIDGIEHLTRGLVMRGCRLVAVDYIGLMASERGKESEGEFVMRTMQRLKALARHEGIAMLLLSQQNDSEGNRPASPFAFQKRHAFGWAGKQAVNTAHTVSSVIWMGVAKETDKFAGRVAAALKASPLHWSDAQVDTLTIQKFVKGRRGRTHHWAFWVNDGMGLVPASQTVSAAVIAAIGKGQAEKE